MAHVPMSHERGNEETDCNVRPTLSVVMSMMMDILTYVDSAK